MRVFFSLFLITLLCACGGGGGGGGSTSSPTYTTRTYSGTSVSVPYSGATLGTPTNISQGATATETVNSSNITQSISITTANGINVSLNRANGDTIAAVSTTVNGGYNNSSTALWGYMGGLGWSYQSFGVWVTGTTSSGTANAASVGTSITPGASIPTTGSAIYSGVAGGLFGNASVVYFVSANMSANANFATRNIAFATTGSVASPALYGTYTDASGLNLTGNLTYAAGTNSFSGTVNSAGYTTMTGNAGGQFYGPNAQEIGGVFMVKAGNYGYIGGFGGKK
jgi:hypothetical protein